MPENEEIRNAIRHLETAADIDEWAANLAVKALRRYKKAKWARVKNAVGKEVVICTRCLSLMQQGPARFCGNCGADMRIKEDKDDE